eukprot:4405838-Amphidinium_carterae.1
METIGTGWVHIDKNERARKGGAKLPLEAKSRLVVHRTSGAGWIPNPLEQAFFFSLLGKDGEVVGLLLTHVDDLLFTGAVVQIDATEALEPAVDPKGAKQGHDSLNPEQTRGCAVS